MEFFLCWPSIGVWLIYSGTHSIGESWFSLFQCVLMTNNFCFGVGTLYTIPCLVLGPVLVGISTGLMFTAIVFVSSHGLEHQSCCVWKTLPPLIHPYPLAHTIFPAPLGHMFLSLEGKSLRKMSPLRLSASKSLTLSAHTVTWHVTVLIPNLRRSFSDVWWARHWYMSIAICY